MHDVLSEARQRTRHLGRGLPSIDFDDVVQEAAIRLWKVPSPLAYRALVAHRAGLNFLRWRARRRGRETAVNQEVLQEAPFAGPTPEEVVASDQAFCAVIAACWAAYDRATPTLRQAIFHLLEIDSLPDATTPRGRVALSKARALMRAEMKQLCQANIDDIFGVSGR